MDSPNPETGVKRKRTPIDEAARIPHPPVPANVTQINYLTKASGERLRLIEGDAETFADVLGMIDDYEGWFCYLYLDCAFVCFGCIMSSDSLMT